MKGTYILVVYLERDTAITVGSLGEINFASGFYLYIGSAMGNKGSSTLEQRVKRHLKPSKKPHWHIDYLLNDKNCILFKIYLIPSTQRLECLIAKEIHDASRSYIKDFGSSDCSCKSHLFYTSNSKCLK